MHQLFNFQSDNSLIRLHGDIEFLENLQIKLRFDWSNPEKVKYEISNSTKLERRDELWKTTCFEAFIQSKANKNYFEVNLSPSGSWNVYEFNEYRKPSPPQEATKWQLIDLNFKPGHLEALIQTGLQYEQDYNIGLSSVIESLDGKIYYYSIAHPGDKPDFHDPRAYKIARTM